MVYAFNLRKAEIRQTVTVFAEPEIAVLVFQHQLAVVAIDLAIEISDPDCLTGSHAKQQIVAITHEVGDLVAAGANLHNAGLVYVQVVERHGPRTSGGLVGYYRNHETVLLQRGNIGDRNSLSPGTPSNIQETGFLRTANRCDVQSL
ncbi:hypothetical protein N434_04547 [Rhizobium sp. UGM030330-04]|nr:hypothetical protein N434_04547 [Rhizobium sp. UGM030330-04]